MCWVCPYPKPRLKDLWLSQHRTAESETHRQPPAQQLMYTFRHTGICQMKANRKAHFRRA